MGFFSGLASGFKTGRQMKADKEETDRLAEYRKSELDYRSSRDDVMDSRYVEERAEQRKRNSIIDARYSDELKYKRGRDDKDDENTDKQWELTIQKWDATQLNTEQIQENADRIYNQAIEAFNANEAYRTEVSLRADSAEARAVAAALYQKERDGIGDDVAEENRLRRIEEYDKSVEQWQQTFDLQEGAAKRAQDQIDISRTESLLSMMPPGMAAQLGGGGSTGPKDGTGLKATTMEAGSSKFLIQLAELGEDEQSSDFFTAAVDSPGAQATIIGFMEAQAKKGNTVTLSDIPKYFKYLGSVPGRGEKEAKEFMASMLSGEANIGDKDTFIKGLMAMKNFVATKELFVQTSAPASLTDQTQMLKTWETSVEMEAYRKVNGLPEAEQEEVQKALSMLRQPEYKQQGMDALASMGFGRTLAMSGNYADNPIISSYYQDTEAAAPAQAAAAPAQAAAVVTETTTQPAAPVPDGGGQTFTDWTEVEVARAKGFSGLATVDGASYDIAPLVIEPEANNGVPTAAMTDAADTLNPTISDDSGFLGTGKVEKPALPENTEIDAMFGDVFKSPIGVEENSPDWNRTTSPVDGASIEEGIPGIERAVKNFEVAPEGASKAAELRESQAVTMVIQELEDMGIEWPTNREELGYFRDDLVALVSDYEVEIPTEIMSKIIEKAKEKSGVGIIPQGDLDRIKRAKKAGDEDTLSNLMNKYGVDPVTDAMGIGN